MSVPELSAAERRAADVENAWVAYHQLQRAWLEAIISFAREPSDERELTLRDATGGYLSAIKLHDSATLRYVEHIVGERQNAQLIAHEALERTEALEQRLDARIDRLEQRLDESARQSGEQLAAILERLDAIAAVLAPAAPAGGER